MVAEGPIGVGTQFRAEITTRGGTLEMLIEITDYERPRRLGSRTSMSGMDTEGTLTFEAVGKGTRMRWSWNVVPRGIFKVMSPLVGFMGRRQEQTIWTSLKRYLESRG